MRVVERKLAALDGGESALLFTTGMSALVGLLLAKLSSGDEVIFFDECYHRMRVAEKQFVAASGVVRQGEPVISTRWKPPSRRTCS